MIPFPKLLRPTHHEKLQLKEANFPPLGLFIAIFADFWYSFEVSAAPVVHRHTHQARNREFLKWVDSALVFGLIMTAKKLGSSRNPRMFPNVAHM